MDNSHCGSLVVVEELCCSSHFTSLKSADALSIRRGNSLCWSFLNFFLIFGVMLTKTCHCLHNIRLAHMIICSVSSATLSDTMKHPFAIWVSAEFAKNQTLSSQASIQFVFGQLMVT
eukprot:TRINITY_DN33980_c0_g1_i2.p1 TRINITY_DN33980_c0_g1~~TRINITY_DN33980_c0_g1_i2.p1  ORF type:complete len:117 (+),score=20.32 TRINITY_DN33980_c0_g1_i2:33-383(+)